MRKLLLALLILSGCQTLPGQIVVQPAPAATATSEATQASTADVVAPAPKLSTGSPRPLDPYVGYNKHTYSLYAYRLGSSSPAVFLNTEMSIIQGTPDGYLLSGLTATTVWAVDPNRGFTHGEVLEGDEAYFITGIYVGIDLNKSDHGAYILVKLLRDGEIMGGCSLSDIYPSCALSGDAP